MIGPQFAKVEIVFSDQLGNASKALADIGPQVFHIMHCSRIIIVNLIFVN